MLLVVQLLACGDAGPIGGVGGGVELSGGGAREVGGADSASAGGGTGLAGTNFDCIGSPELPVVVTASEVQVMLSLSYFRDLHDLDVLTGATVVACQHDDIACEAPIATALESESAGQYEMTLPVSGTGFDGYFLGVSDETIPWRMYAHPVITKDTQYDYSLLDSPTSIDQTLVPAGLSQDPGRGLAFVAVFDCDHGEGPQLAQNMTVTIEGGDGLTSVHYLDELGQNIEPEAIATTESGIALVLNLPLSAVTAHATNQSGQFVQGRPFRAPAGSEVAINVVPGARLPE